MENYIEHRKRVKERFRREGLDNFDEKHVLEMLLFYCVPRQDTKALAYNLLQHFGSIAEVLDAAPEELERVPGVGEGISTFLSFRRQLERYYKLKKDEKETRPLKSAEDYGRVLAPKFEKQSNEVVYVLCLDGKFKMLSCIFVGEGSVNSANIPISRIVQLCLNTNATYVVLAHNHPSGLALPSNEDIHTTNYLAHAMDTVELKLLDHLVFTDGDYVSLSQSGYYAGPDNAQWYGGVL